MGSNPTLSASSTRPTLRRLPVEPPPEFTRTEDHRPPEELGDTADVVTGAASGMEFACAQRFAGDGMHVVLADFESEPLALAGATIKVRAAG